ncbi:hypothetical protein R3W88_006415 [Solanum pinnatisectum]|uniref:Xaa-Pro aminopeptidase n=1 Tax=Solanum pinnatisectum TaxID=50273 RepID=A0AAV9KFG0_9SOLN|nr:hypothetical protein R3W88_006415 [Solanum pinnatisectum]
MDEALLWTDGRYFLQATQQLSDQWKLMRMGDDPPVDIWMANNLPKDAAIGVDTWCISVDTAQKWECAFAKKQQKLVQTTRNLVDEVWKNRLPAQANPVIVHPLQFAGQSVADKLKELRRKLVLGKARAIIITALDEVAWLYNVRGSDVSYCPVVHAFAIVTIDSAFFYVDKQKLSPEANSYMEENGIIGRDYGDISSDVVLLGSKGNPKIDVRNATYIGNSASHAVEFVNDLIWVDPGACCFASYSKLTADKNPVEIEGLKKAHFRDGAAVVQYLVWLDKQMQEIYRASGYFMEAESTKQKKQLGTKKLTEVSVSDKLEEFRASKEHFRGLSFPTTSSVGSNAAIIHYNLRQKHVLNSIEIAFTYSILEHRYVRTESIYSGFLLCILLYLTCALSIYMMVLLKYLDGTTDITRTIHFGKPSPHEKSSYMAVLKGHISLGNARFPNGTNGQSLDILARIPLWKDGLDYRHGTGHGIGSYLNVHEGPHNISFRQSARDVPLQVSMAVTDEPGYYEDGNFGIRIENVLIVKEGNTKFNFGNKGYLSFEHITWAPYQRKLIDVSLLVPEEIEWLNEYHAKCREILTPYLNTSEMEWLKKATEPIAA